jgi:hypothetical protein
MKAIRAKYVEDKKKIEVEIGDLREQRAQLVEAVKKLKEQQVQLKRLAIDRGRKRMANVYHGRMPKVFS